MNKDTMWFIIIMTFVIGGGVTFHLNKLVDNLQNENNQLKQTMFGSNKYYYYTQSIITLTITNNTPSWVMENK